MPSDLRNLMQPFADLFQRAFSNPQNPGSNAPNNPNNAQGGDFGQALGGFANLINLGFGNHTGQGVQPQAPQPTQQPWQPLPSSGNGGFLDNLMRSLFSIGTLFFGVGAIFKKGIKQVNRAAELDEEDSAECVNEGDSNILRGIIARLAATNERAASHLNEQFRNEKSLLNNTWDQVIKLLFSAGQIREVDSTIRSREDNAHRITHARFGIANARYLAILNQMRAMEFEQALPEYQKAVANVRMEMVQAILQAEQAAKVAGANVATIDQNLSQRLQQLWNGHANTYQAMVEGQQQLQRLQLAQKELAERMQVVQRDLETHARLQPFGGARPNIAPLRALQDQHAAAVRATQQQQRQLLEEQQARQAIRPV